MEQTTIGYDNPRFAFLCGYESEKAGLGIETAREVHEYYGSNNMDVDAFLNGVEDAQRNDDWRAIRAAGRLENDLGFIAPIWSALQRAADVQLTAPTPFRFDNEEQSRYFMTLARFRGWRVRFKPSAQPVLQVEISNPD